jgi:hypothetical protein
MFLRLAAGVMRSVKERHTSRISFRAPCFGGTWALSVLFSLSKQKMHEKRQPKWRKFVLMLFTLGFNNPKMVHSKA